MKIKHLLLIAGMFLLLGACKRNVTNPSNDSEDEVISLTSGAVLGRAANVGLREKFETGDQIGVLAVYATDDASPAPRWDTTAHFENKVAAYVSNDTSNPVISTFGWGPAAEGKEHNQYYPSKKRNIFLYSYYPYVASGSGSNYVSINPTATTDAERQPKMNVELVHGQIGDAVAEDVLQKQPDILYYIGSTAISSATTPKPSPMLSYNHALAQIRFTVKRPDGSSPCKFMELVFKTTGKGVLNLATGNFSYAAAETDNSNRRDAVYTIQISDPAKVDIPEEGIDPSNPEYLDILNPDKATNFNYLMVFPLLKADAELSEIKLTCNFGVGGVDDIRTFNIPLTAALKDWVAGKMNTLALNVSLFSVSLTASITPWGQGDIVELPAE